MSSLSMHALRLMKPSSRNRRVTASLILHTAPPPLITALITASRDTQDKGGRSHRKLRPSQPPRSLHGHVVELPSNGMSVSMLCVRLINYQVTVTNKVGF